MNLAASLTRFIPHIVRERGVDLFRQGVVRLQIGDQKQVLARVRGTRDYTVTLTREAGDVFATCDCPYFDSEGICKHIWAVILAASNAGHLGGARNVAPTDLVAGSPDDEDLDEDDDVELGDAFDYGASRVFPSLVRKWEPSKPSWRDAVRGVVNSSARHEDVWPEGRELYYVIDATNTVYSGNLSVSVGYRDRKKDGSYGKVKHQRIPRELVARIPSPEDRDLLAMLGGVPNVSSFNDQVTLPVEYRLNGGAVTMLLPKMAATDRLRLRKNSGVEFENQTALSLDDGNPWDFRVKAEQDNGQWIFTGTLERGEERLPLERLDLILESGWAVGSGLVFRFDHKNAFAWLAHLRRLGGIKVPVNDSDEFVRSMLEHPIAPPIDWPEALRCDLVEVKPQPRILIDNRGANGRKTTPLSAHVSFDYGGEIFELRDNSRYRFMDGSRKAIRRDAAAEKAALDFLVEAGCARRQNYGHDFFAIAPGKVPKVLSAVVRAGWHVEFQGKVFRNSSGFRAQITSNIDWFELHGAVDFGDHQVSLPELLKALRKGETVVELGDGSYGLVPDEIVDRYGFLLNAGTAAGDHMRFGRTQTGLLDAILASRGEIEVDAMFHSARERLRGFENIGAADQPPGFQGRLREYQREGVAWMQFLREFGFGGCLADDMGVGKTPQVLAVLEGRRELRRSGEPVGPSLVVVPRSLIYNWKQEAAKFTPELQILDHSGSERNRAAENFADYDVVLTTYGTLRRDAVRLQHCEFDYIVLDEANAIKNIGSESAKAARILRGRHRLAMTGTPVENHLGELYSLFEFLNPGMLNGFTAMLGGASLRNPDEAARDLLGRAIRPFILRRTKDQVASELPKKLEQTIYCELDAAERKRYNDLRDHYRKALFSQVEQQGMAKSKMHVLEALLRLRQAACHSGLLDAKLASTPSSKTETLLEQLDEIVDEGHKALVFSQFTTLLDIVKKQLDSKGLIYEYLDGATRDRQARVERFQTDADCKLFLISLKAGGVGLNLTSADYVFLLDPWWNPAVESQAIDRTHRIGQTRSAFAYRLIARDTIEEKVLQLQDSKRNLADAIIRADTNLVRDLKREDLDFLFS